MIDLGHWYDPLADVIFKPFCNSPAKGVQPALRALSVTEEDDKEPRYFVGKGSRPVSGRYVDPALDARIWAATEALITV